MTIEVSLLKTKHALMELHGYALEHSKELAAQVAVMVSQVAAAEVRVGSSLQSKRDKQTEIEVQTLTILHDCKYGEPYSRFIEAVKYYRNHTGLGLLESKFAVEKLRDK